MKTDRDIFLKVSLMILCCRECIWPSQACGVYQGEPRSESAGGFRAVECDREGSQDPGERKFQANCSRCHDAPEQLSPRITGTVLRHMRVRASLSAEDERDILRYLAP